MEAPNKSQSEDDELEGGSITRPIFDLAQPILSSVTKQGKEERKQSNEEGIDRQRFLDDYQYTLDAILKLESIYGADFVIPGGLNKTQQFIDELNLNPNSTVLDIGCGIGGSAFYITKKYGAKVIGYNFSSNTHKIATQRYLSKCKEDDVYKDKIEFKLCDPTKLELDGNKYDVIYSRDILLHVFDKTVLFNNFFKWLKPNGILFISDYCIGKKQSHSQSLLSYIETFKYQLHTISDYTQFIKNAGFQRFDAKDCTDQFIKILQSELDEFKLNKNQFISTFDENSYNELHQSWTEKIQRCLEGDQKWGQFTAIKLNTTSSPQSASKQFLDNHQYTKNGVLRYEKIFGQNFVSTGGIKTTSKFVDKYLNLQKGQKVLDVGCGIGGSAFYMAQKYKVNVLGIDLSDNMLNIANQRLMQQNNINNLVSFKLCDATKQKFPENSFDVIYSRDTILHIYDKLTLFQSFLKWLKPGGILFITDYCCGKSPHSVPFTQYLKDRKYHLYTPSQYTEIIKNAGFVNVDGQDATNQFVKVLQYELDHAQQIRNDFVTEFSEKDYEYIIKGWKAKLIRCNDGDQKWGIFCGHKPNKSASKEFLDSHQYTTNSILRYERIFGKHFISTGGIATTTKFVEKLNLKKAQYVLDVGCGIGGSAFYMAQQFGANVLGIDLSENMLNIAKERLKEEIFPSNVTVSFELSDATKRKFDDNTFDVIYSRDCILHIHDKLALFSSFLKWLKPGGVLFITDYCCGKPPHSVAFEEYLKDRKYHLYTPSQYAQIIKNAGFSKVIGNDETDQFVTVLKSELDQFALIKNDFVNEFSEKDYNYILKGWQSKVVRCNDGDQKWGSFIGYKPQSIIDPDDDDEKSIIYQPQKQSASKEFLDSHQYTKNSILRYERIFGKHFISTGGVATTKKFVEKLNLKKAQYALDVGCGIGGSAFYMAQQFGVNVLGIDLSQNMLNIAKERLEEEIFPSNVSVSFELSDATKREFDENTFDVIYSRDCILHIYDKLALFKNFNKWLKPGGVLFITDYCCGSKPHSVAFEEYLKDRKYHLYTPSEYTEIIKNAGFVSVVGKDETEQFVNVLNDELNKFALIKDEFSKEFSEKDYEYIVNGWKSKVVRCTEHGDQKWGSFIGYKSK